METEPIEQVMVGSENDTNISYAGDLARELKVPLFVYRKNYENIRKYRSRFGFFENDDPTERLRVKTEALVSPETEFFAIDWAEVLAPILKTSIIVTDKMTDEARVTHALLNFSAKAIFPNKARKILMPLGCDATSKYTHESGLSLAKQILDGKGTVIFYHTTWKNEDIAMADPHEHMCREATDILRAAESLAKSMGISYTSQVQTDEDVVEGIIETALRQDADLIVMSRDPGIIRGDYCEQLYKEPSPVPILVLKDQPLNKEGF